MVVSLAFRASIGRRTLTRTHTGRVNVHVDIAYIYLHQTICAYVCLSHSFTHCDETIGETRLWPVLLLSLSPLLIVVCRGGDVRIFVYRRKTTIQLIFGLTASMSPYVSIVWSRKDQGGAHTGVITHIY